MNVFVVLTIALIFIVVATVKFKVHPVFSLFIAALASGLLLGTEPMKVITLLSEGFGKTLSSIGLVIAFGTVIGVYLEKTGGARVLAERILRIVGLKYAALGMNFTGFVVSIPVFCDSGFIILSSLNKVLSKRSGLPVIFFAVALATGLYAAHVFVPPTPGPLAAAAILEADIALVMLLGLGVAIPVSLVGFFWAKIVSKLASTTTESLVKEKEIQEDHIEVKPVVKFSQAVLPLIVPILLIAVKSIINLPGNFLGSGILFKILDFLGNPVIALFIGVLFSLNMKTKATLKARHQWIVTAFKEAGLIILITGAGGAFGTILREINIASYLDLESGMLQSGIIISFTLAAILKTAQGSSTVAIITTAAIVAPLLNTMGLETTLGKALTVLAIGAGAMTVSHVNDSYFWVVSQFSNMNVKTALKSFTMATLLQGITGLLIILMLQTIFG